MNRSDTNRSEMLIWALKENVAFKSAEINRLTSEINDLQALIDHYSGFESISGEVNNLDTAHLEPAAIRRERGSNEKAVLEFTSSKLGEVWSTSEVAQIMGLPKSSVQQIFGNTKLFRKVGRGRYQRLD